MSKEGILIIVFINLCIFAQQKVKEEIKKMTANILNIKSYNVDISAQVTIQEVLRYFENVSVTLTYVRHRKKLKVEGVPLLPNNAILTKQIKSSVDKVWDYLLFPYIFDVLTEERFLSVATVHKLDSDNKKIVIKGVDKYIKNISTIEYITEADFLPKVVNVFYTDGSSKLIKLTFEKVTGGNYVISGVEEEVKSLSRGKIYKSLATISYSNINNFILPTQISYEVTFAKISDVKFTTTMSIAYQVAKTTQKRPQRKSIVKEDSTASSKMGETEGGKKEGGKKLPEGNSKKAQCIPTTK